MFVIFLSEVFVLLINSRIFAKDKGYNAIIISTIVDGSIFIDRKEDWL